VFLVLRVLNFQKGFLMFHRFNSAKEAVRRHAQRVSVGTGLVLASGVASAQASLPAGAADLFTDAAAVFALVIAAAYVLMIAVKGGWITFDMVKKGASKAAK
jgi:hypothetical protein